MACSKLYDFIWDVFCDWYIELTKPRIQTGGEAKASAQAVLVWAMKRILKLLHPFMPFITEEIWQVLVGDNSMIMMQAYPVYEDALNYAEDEAAFEKIISAIKAVRNTRTELNVPPSVKAKLYIETAEPELFAAGTLFFEKLASASDVEIGAKFDMPDAAGADIDFLSKKLNNAGFLAKAPEPLINAERAKLAKAEEKMSKIQQSIRSFS